jgi:membrane-bound ClpP family serine protease
MRSIYCMIFESSIMPDAAVLATMLLLLGLFLLGLEFFIPSFGMILTVAVISLVVSFWCACKAWWGVNPSFFWTYVVLLLAGIPGSLFSAIAIMQKTSLGNRLILRPPPVAEKKPANPLDEMIGQRGIAQTLLTPGGMVNVNNGRFHAESIGMLIEPQAPVVVVAVRGNRIVVQPASLVETGESQQTPGDRIQPMELELNPPVELEISGINPASLNSAECQENGDRLDFEIPDDYTQSPET